MPNWIGAELVRLVAFDGEHVRLSTPPTPVGGRQQIATLIGSGRKGRGLQRASHQHPCQHRSRMRTRDRSPSPVGL